MFSLYWFVASGCYRAEANSRTAARIYFFINVDFHNTILQKRNQTRSQLNPLDFYGKDIIGRLSSATSSGPSPNTSFRVKTFPPLSSTISRYPLLHLSPSFLLGSFSRLLTSNGNRYCLVISVLRRWIGEASVSK